MNNLERLNRILISVAFAIASISVTGCNKKVAPPPVAAAAPPVVVAPSPTASINASPAAVTAGNPVVLSWSTTNANAVSIDGIGTVTASGTRTITPTASTTYRLVARNDRDSAAASARVTVNPRPVAVAAVDTMSTEEEFKAHVQDIFFDYDKYTIRPQGENALAQDASFFESHPNLKIVIGGYADERGSAEFNVALGQDRAAAAKKVLIDAGVPATQLRVISYGKERPFCTEENETCWQKNRRAGFALDR